MKRINKKSQGKFYGSAFGPFMRPCPKTGRDIPYCYLDVETELFVIELNTENKPTIRTFDYLKDEQLFLSDTHRIQASQVFEIESDRDLLTIISPALARERAA